MNSLGFSYLNRKIKKTFEILTLCFFDKRSLILKKLIQYFLSFFYLKLFLLCYGIEKLLFSYIDKKCIGSTKKYFDFVDQYASPQEAQDIIVIPRIKSRMWFKKRKDEARFISTKYELVGHPTLAKKGFYDFAITSMSVCQ